MNNPRTSMSPESGHTINYSTRSKKHKLLQGLQKGTLLLARLAEMVPQPTSGFFFFGILLLRARRLSNKSGPFRSFIAPVNLVFIHGWRRRPAVDFARRCRRRLATTSRSGCVGSPRVHVACVAFRFSYRALFSC